VNEFSHPAEVIDMTHSMMFVAAHDLLTGGRELAPGAYAIPDRLDREVAERKLATLDATIDEATDAQREHAVDWHHEDT
jgi:adenosylhomocysteinase